MDLTPMEILSFANVGPGPNISAHLPFPSLKARSLEAASMLQDAADAQRMEELLKNSSPSLINRIADQISQVNANIRLRDEPENTAVNSQNLERTPLYQTLLKLNPDLFKPLEKAKERARKTRKRRKESSNASNIDKVPQAVISVGKQIILPAEEGDEESIMIVTRKSPVKEVETKVESEVVVEISGNDLEKEISFEELVGSLIDSEYSISNSDMKRLDSTDIIRKVSSEIVRLNESGKLNEADSDLLSSLLVALNAQMDKALEADIIIESSRISSEVLDGIEATFVVLRTMSTPKMPRKVFLSEVLDTAIAFIEHLLNDFIYPLFEKSTKEKSKDLALAKTILGRICTLLDLLAELICIEKLEDTLLLKISSIALSSFLVEGLNSLQLASLNLIRAVFRKNTQLRSVVFDDIFNSFAKLPTSKRNLRNFRVDGMEGTSIQMVSALVMQLIHCFSEIPTDHAEGEDYVDNSFNAAMSSANSFLQSFISRCITTVESTDYRSLFENFVIDLVTVVSVPEFPSAEMFLQIIVSILLRRLSDKTSDVSVRNFAVDIVGIIASRMIHEIIEAKATFDQLLGEKGESDGVEVFCICHLPEDGRFMIECDDCNRWFHGECVGILSEKVPDKWSCDLCGATQKAKDRVASLSENKPKPKPKPKPKKRGGRRKKGTKQTTTTTTTTEDWEPDKEKSKNPTLESIISADPSFLLRSLLLDYFDQKYKLDSSIEYVRQFHVAQWYSEEGTSDMAKEYYSSVWPCSASLSGQNSVFNFERMMKITRQLAQGRAFYSSFDAVLSHILVALHDSSGQLRSRALKALAVFVETDPTILGEERVKLAVQGRFLDNSILVRESAIDLVGRFLFFRPEFVEQYYETISRHLLDTGISVRKRVVRIMKSICITQPGHARVSDILVRLVGRINDESVKDLVVKTFEEVWFSVISFSGAEVKERASSDVVMKRVHGIISGSGSSEAKASNNFIQAILSNSSGTKQSKTKEEEEKLDELVLTELHQRTAQIVRVVANVAHHDWLTELLQNAIKGEKPLEDELDTLANETENISLKSQPVHTLLGAMVSHLVHHILSIEEKRVAEQGITVTNDTPENKILPCLKTLEVFCSVLPDVVASNISLLVPYLASSGSVSTDTRYTEDQAVMSTVCDIMTTCTPHLKWTGQNVLEDMERQLTLIVFKEGVTAVQSAVQALSALINEVTRNTPLLHELLTKFYRLLCAQMPLFDANIEGGWPGDQTNLIRLMNGRPTLFRSLFTAGLLCRYFDFDGCIMDADETSSLLVPGQIVRKIFDAYVHYCVNLEKIIGLSVSKNAPLHPSSSSSGDTFSFNDNSKTKSQLTPELYKTVIETHLRALQGLGQLFVRQPHLMIEKESYNIFSVVLASGSPVPLKVQGLRNFAEFLANEEKLMLTLDKERAATPMRSSTPIRPTTPTDAKGAQGDSGLSSGLMQTYLKLILNLSVDSEASVRLASIKVLGLVLRQGLVLPVLCVPHVMALEADPESSVRDAAHMIMVFLSERYSGFVKNAHVLIQGIKLAQEFHKNCPSNSPVNPCHGFGKFYQKNICSDRFTRNQFLQQLVAKFEWSEDDVEVDMDFLPFLTEVIANLPYSVQDEILLLIHSINRVLSLKGGSLLSRLKNKFSSVKTGADGSVVAVYDSDEDTYTPVANAKSSVTMEDSVHVLQLHCQSMILLLKAKAYLKAIYGLSNQKCQEFSPLAAVSIVRPCNRNDSPPFSSGTAFKVSKITKSEENTQSFDQLRQDYEHFKQLMQDDADDVGEFAAAVLPSNRYGRKRNLDSKKPKKKSTKKKRVKYTDNDDDFEYYDEDDEDYVG